MIRAITPYNTNFGNRQKMAQKSAQQVARKVVNVKDSSLKGITKTPIRALDDISQMGVDGVAVLSSGMTAGICGLGTLSNCLGGSSAGYSIGAGLV